MSYVYDPENVFAKILRGEIPNKTVFETEHTLAFEDINPQAPTHVLVIPKGPYATFDHFVSAASEIEIADFFRSVGKVAEQTGVAESAGGDGYRTITNAGPNGVQEVPHFHLHVLGGRRLGRMLQRE